jgi:hypothetical protein
MKTSLLVALVCIAGLGPVARAAVEVKAFRLEETRTVEFGDDKVSRTPPRMNVILSLHGPEAESSVRYGNLKLEEAVDDQGFNLLSCKDPFNDLAKFKDYSNAFFRKSKASWQGPPADPQVELSLTLPKRAATKIVRLRGTVTLSDQGTIQSSELTNLKQAGKRALRFPPGVHLSVSADVASGDAVRSIGIEISGDEALLESIEVVDGSGKKVGSGMSSWSFNGGPAHKSIELSKPLDDTMKLVAKFALNRKLTAVSFDLKDIPLP